MDQAPQLCPMTQHPPLAFREFFLLLQWHSIAELPDNYIASL